VTLPTVASDFHRRGHLKCRVHMPCVGCAHLKSECYYRNS